MSDNWQRLEPLRREKRWIPPILIFGVVGYFAVLILTPILGLLRQAFAHGFRDFFAVVAQPDVLHALSWTFVLSGAAVLVNAAFGLAVAWVLVRDEFYGKRFLNALVDLPFAVSPVVAGYMLILLFGREGWFRPLLDRTGIQVLFSLPGMFLVTIFVSLPFVIREVMPVLQEIGVEEEQAAQTLGASGWQTFWRVTLPSVRWALLYGITLTFARAMGEFGALFVVSGAVTGETETATLYVFRAMDERLNLEAYAVSSVLACVSFLLLMTLEFLKKRLRES